MEVIVKKITTAVEDAALIQLWERSVRASHSFLKETDLLEIKTRLPNYFRQVDLKGWYLEDTLIGFSGRYEDSLEMLFLDPSVFGQGLGKEILARLIKEDGICKVEVNEQNEGARVFYQKQGFQQIGRSETDGEGRPYPLLQLVLTNN